MENNKAFCAYLKNIQPIAGADRIVQADIVLNNIKITQVVVGKDTIEDTMVVYFDSNMCLTDEFITFIDKQSPEYGTEGFSSLGEYLGKHNRVKVVKLRGVISNGLAVEATKFRKLYLPNMEEGFSFTELNGHKICSKYLPPAKTLMVQGKKGKKVKATSKMVPDQFHFHIDTDQLLRNVNKLNPGQIISISRKVHGTSAIVSNCLVKRPLTLTEKIRKVFGGPVEYRVYDYIYASRTVIKNEAMTDGFYGTDLWTKVGKDNFVGKLHKGESVYYEIVGYAPGTQTMIQKGYKYGCSEGQYKIAVYRITMTNADGIVTELGWSAVKARCLELQVPMVEEYYFGGIDHYMKLPNIGESYTVEMWRTDLIAQMKLQYLEKEAPDCDNNPDEGVVIRIEGLNIEAYKLKSEKFLLKESKAKDEGTVDIEDEEQAQA
jgi:hypothetical protein